MEKEKKLNDDEWELTKQKTVFIAKEIKDKEDNTKKIKQIMGTGIVVAPTGIILTCWHVFEDCQVENIAETKDFTPVYVRFCKNKQEVFYRAKLIYPRTENLIEIQSAIKKDLALLKIEEIQEINLPYCIFYPSPEKLIEIMRNVQLLGYPSGSSIEGKDYLLKISSIKQYYHPLANNKNRERKYQNWDIDLATVKEQEGIVLDKAVEGGYSGGPVLHWEKEQIIGITTTIGIEKDKYRIDTSKGRDRIKSTITIITEENSWTIIIPKEAIDSFLKEATEKLKINIMDYQKPKISKKELKKAEKIYSLIWESLSDLKEDRVKIMKLRAEESEGYSAYYCETEEDNIFQKLIDDRKNVIVTGRPISGKTRLFYQWVKEKEDILVITPRYEDIKQNEFFIPPSYDNKKTKILFLDDLQQYVKSQNFSHLLWMFLRRKDIIIIATCHFENYEDVEKLLCRSVERITLDSAFTELKLVDIDDNDAMGILKHSEGANWQKKWLKVKNNKTFDGTKGSLFLPLDEMKIRYKECNLVQEKILKTIKRAYATGMYIGQSQYPISWIQTLIECIYKLGLGEYEFKDELKKLEKKRLLKRKEELLKVEEAYIVNIIEPNWELDLTKEIELIINCMKSNPEAMIYLGYNLVGLGNINKTEKEKYYYKASKVYNSVLRIIENKVAQNIKLSFEEEGYLEKSYFIRGYIYTGLGMNTKAIDDYNRAIESDQKNVLAYINRGNAYSELGEKAKAIDDYNRAIEIDPENALAYNNRGTTYIDLGEKAKAIEDYNRAIESDQKNALAYFNRGTAYSNLGEKAKAINDYNKAIEIDPEYVDAYFNRGNAYSNLEEKAKAIDDYNKVIEIDPEYVDAYFNRGTVYSDLGENAKAIDDYNKAIEIDQKNALAYINRGNVYFKLGEKVKAIEDYNIAIEIDQKNAEAYFNRGIVYSDIGEKAKAIDDYNKVIEIDPKNADAYNNRGTTYIDLREKTKAIEDYNKAIEIDQKNALAYNNRGNVYFKLGEKVKAIEDYNKAIEIDQKNARAYLNRGNVYSDIGENAKAIKDYNKVIEIDPEYVDTYNNRGYAYSELGENAKAIKDYNKVIEIDQKNALAYFNRGTVYLELGEKVKAIDDYNKVIEIDPEYVDAYFNRGTVYSDLGENAKAIDDYNKAIEIDQKNALAYFNRGNVYFKLGEKIKAIEDYNKSIELDSQHAEAYDSRGCVYRELGKYDKALEDFNKVIELNPNLYETYSNRGNLYKLLGKNREAKEDFSKVEEIKRKSARK